MSPERGMRHFRERQPLRHLMIEIPFILLCELYPSTWNVDIWFREGILSSSKSSQTTRRVGDELQGEKRGESGDSVQHVVGSELVFRCD